VCHEAERPRPSPARPPVNRAIVLAGTPSGSVRNPPVVVDPSAVMGNFASTFGAARIISADRVGP
jgi:hypothetical protein